MISAALPFMSLLALGAAQSSTVSLFLPFADQQSLVASIAGSDPTATSYVVTCAGGAAASTSAAATASSSDDDDSSGYDNIGEECGLQSAITVVQGPSTVHFSISSGTNIDSVNCQLMGVTKAICTDSATGADLLTDSQPALQTATLSASEIQFLPVVITAGSVTAKQAPMATSASVTGMTTAKAMSMTSASANSQATSSTKTSGSDASNASAQSTNAAAHGSPVYGAGILGALGVAVAGAML